MTAGPEQPGWVLPQSEVGPAPAPHPEVPRPLLRGPALGLAGVVVLAAATVVASAPAGLAFAVACVSVVAVVIAGGFAPADTGGRAVIAAAALLALAPLVRDAGWVVALDLVLAAVLAAIALADGSALGLVRGPARVLGAAVAGPLALTGDAVRALPRGNARRVAPAARGALLAAALLVAFGGLFVSADQAFAELAHRALPDVPDVANAPARLAVAAAFVVTLGAFALAAAHLRAAGPDTPLPDPSRRLAPAEWIPGLGVLVALFAAFVAVQFVVLFGGDEHVLRTAGLTYATYARQGFGQLVVVVALVLAVIAVAWRYVAAEGRQVLLLRGLLLALCACTLVVVASALYRLDLYVDAFGATRLRLQAAALCALLGGFVLLGAAAIAAGRAGWVPRAGVLLTAVIALAVTAADPDRRIAERNVDRYERTGRIDAWYLQGLSADAAPALARLPPGQRSAVGLACPAAGDGVAGFNVGRAAARRALRC